MQQPDQFIVVRTADIAATSLGDYMSQIRNWLDHRRIDLANFRSVSVDAGTIAFEAHFRELEHAELFRAAFCARPSVPLQDQG